jgi:hypothetical protein
MSKYYGGNKTCRMCDKLIKCGDDASLQNLLVDGKYCVVVVHDGCIAKLGCEGNFCDGSVDVVTKRRYR